MTTSKDSNQAGFYGYLVEAIELNRVRRDYYDDVTDGRTRSLSNRLILSERLCLPVARYFDAKARPFNEAGVGVVSEDFVSMEDVGDPQTPPRYTGQVLTIIHKFMKGLRVTCRSVTVAVTATVTRRSPAHLDPFADQFKDEVARFLVLAIF